MNNNTKEITLAILRILAVLLIALSIVGAIKAWSGDIMNGVMETIYFLSFFAGVLIIINQIKHK